MSERLAIIADGRVMGEVRKDRRSRLTFAYDASWVRDLDAYPLSLSMPLVIAEHEHARIETWLSGLLPDNDAILARWGQRLQVSPRNAFALLAHVGEDCAGAIQIVRPERVAALLRRRGGQVQWLTEQAIGERLRLLRRDQAAWRIASDTGQFSLAGTQPKTALLHQRGRWGVPSGRTPTTHILKPPIATLQGHAENEHVCLALARALGLPAAASRVHKFDGEAAIVIERYDRMRVARSLHRLHQEDMCQALGRSPAEKYENEGGPGVLPIIELLRTHSSRPCDDVRTFVQALAFNWLIGASDAHAKNFSVLIGGAGRVRLAPLYDVASALPYDFDHKKLRLAMKVGGTYRLAEIARRQWRKLASSVRLNEDEVLALCRDLAERLPDVLADVTREARAGGLDRAVLRRLADPLNARAIACRRSLAA